MLDHVKYVHPEKPYSRTMYQMFWYFKCNRHAELEKINKGSMEARVKIVRVEDMDEYEHLNRLLPDDVITVPEETIR